MDPNLLLEAIFQFGPAWALLLLGLVLGYRIANRLIDIWAAHLTNRVMQVAKMIQIVEQVTKTAERVATAVESYNK